MMSVSILCAFAFVLGAIPFGFLAGKMRGVDLREHGSGNIGATNVLRTLGKGPAAIVFLLDALKGFVPVYIAQKVLHLSPPGWTVAAGLAAILGHTFTPFLRFKGGKGVATSLGVLLGLSWMVALAALAVFIVVVTATRYVSLGSIIGALTQAALLFLIPGHPAAFRWFGLTAALFVVYKHTENIRRLLAGTENRVGAKKTATVDVAAPAPPPPAV